MDQADINEKLKEQGEILQQLVEQNKKNQKTLNWLRAIGVIKLVIILAPIILAIIYLPPVIRRAIEEYKEIIPGLEKVQEIIERQNPNTLERR